MHGLMENNNPTIHPSTNPFAFPSAVEKFFFQNAAKVKRR